MKNCPNCKSHVQTETKKRQDLQLDYCPKCQLLWLDFGFQRPHLYQAIEEQTQRWEEHVKRRQC